MFKIYPVIFYNVSNKCFYQLLLSLHLLLLKNRIYFQSQDLKCQYLYTYYKILNHVYSIVGIVGIMLILIRVSTLFHSYFFWLAKSVPVNNDYMCNHLPVLWCYRQERRLSNYNIMTCDRHKMSLELHFANMKVDKPSWVFFFFTLHYILPRVTRFSSTLAR